MVPGERELQGIRGDRGYEDTYLVFDRQNNIGELGGAGTFGLAHDPGDEIVEIVLTLTLAQNPTETMQRVLAGLNSIGDDAAALAAAQAALAVPAPVDPSDFEPAGAVATHTGDTSGAHAASAISNTAAGNISATDVQAAINELDSEKQPLDTDLTAIADLTSAADKVPYATGAGTWALADFVSFARTLSALNSAQTVCAALRTWWIVAASGVSASCPADTTEDQLASITLPANSLGANGGCRIHTLWTCTNNANNKTMRVRWSGAAGTQMLNTTQTTVAFFRDVREFWNQNATNSQRYHAGSNPYGPGASVPATMAVDTTASTTVVITGQKANSGDTLTLNWYAVELFYQA